MSHPPESYTNIDTQVEKWRNNNQQHGSNPKRPKHPDRRTMLKQSDSALYSQHHKHKKRRSHHKYPTSIQPQCPTTKLLRRATKAYQPTSPKSKKRRNLQLLHRHRPRPPPHRAHDENLRANSFQQGENDENLMGLFNARILDKKTRKYLFDIVLANIRGLRWGDIDDNN